MTRAIKWLTRILIAALALVIVAVLAAVAILNSEAGTRWVLEQIDRRTAGELRVDTFSGTLWSGISIPALSYEDDSRRITAAGLSIEFDWAAMSPSRIAVGPLSATSIDFENLAPAPPEPEPLQMAMRPLPIDVVVARSTVNVFRYSSSGRAVTTRGIELVDFHIRGNRMTASSAAAAYEAGSLALNRASLQLDGDVPASADFVWKTIDESWSGSGSVRGSLAELAFVHELQGSYPADIEGTIRLLRRTEPQIEANVRWSDWQYGAYESESGQLHLSGWFNSFRTRFDFGLSDMRGRSLRLVGNAVGDAGGLSEIDARVRSAVGLLDASGSLRWAPDFSADVRFTGQDLDLSHILPIPEMAVGVDLSLVMSAPRDFRAIIHSVDGTYMNDRFRGRGTFSLKERLMQCRGCEISVGANRVSVQGSVADNVLALDLGIRAPVLAQLWPGISGSLRLDGTLRGAITAPVFNGHVSAQSLAYSGLGIGRLEIDSVDSTIEKLDFAARLEDVRRDDRALGTFDLLMRGAVSRLQARIGWTYDEISGEALGSLDLSSQDARGTVDSATLEHPKAGIWQATNAFPVTTGLRAVDIGAHTWRRGDAELNIDELAFVDGRARIAANARDIPLELLQFAMPQNFELTGLANSDIRLTYEQALWSGSVSWAQKDSQLRVQQSTGERVDIVVPAARLDATLHGNSAEATASIRIDPGVAADLQLSMSPLSADAAIDARLVIAGSEWHWIPALVPELDRFEGVIEAEIAARGQLRRPNFSGELRWRNGALLVPAFNAPLTDIEVIVAGAAEGAATVTGSARAGAGKVAANGRLDNLMQDNRSFTIRLTGSDADIVDWTDYRISASPDLQIAGSAEGVSVSGEVLVPRAEIAVRRIPEETVSTSGDVSVIGRTSEPVAGVPVTGHIDLELGRNVHVQALGLDTGLRGKLGLTVAKGQDLRAEGELVLVEGVFEAYGQRLTITEGTLLFTGPLDDPVVNVRAIRKIESLDTTVTAGIELRGRASNLVANVFSEPVMAEAEALSYLVLGRPLTQATAAEGDQLSGAAVALGLRQAGRITNQIGQAFGLDELNVSGDGGSTTALVAGKQLSSRVYVRYAYGVFSQLGAFLLRYRLSSRLTLEASTGESQSMDILYLVEKP